MSGHRISVSRREDYSLPGLNQLSGICSVDHAWLNMLVSHLTTALPPLLQWYRCPMNVRSLVDVGAFLTSSAVMSSVMQRGQSFRLLAHSIVQVVLVVDSVVRKKGGGIP